MSKSSEILVSACSFGVPCEEIYVRKDYEKYGYRIEDLPFEFPNHEHWPKMLEDKLKTKVVNLSISGSGNYSICKRATDYIIKNHKKIKVCIISLSEWWRVEYSITMKRCEESIEQPVHNKKEFYRKSVKNTLRSIYEFQMICDRFKIPYMIFQMLPIYREKAERRAPYILEDDYFNLIDKKYCVGWPFTNYLGGYDFYKKHFSKNKLELCVGNMMAIRSDRKLQEPYLHKILFDWHPNQKGHELICEKVIEQLMEHKLWK